VAFGGSRVRLEKRGVHVGDGLEDGRDEQHGAARDLGHEEHSERGQELHVELGRGHEQRDGETHEAARAEAPDGGGVEHEPAVGADGQEDGVEEMHEHEVHGDGGVCVLGAAEDSARDAAGGAREEQRLHHKLCCGRSVAHAEAQRGQGRRQDEQHREQIGRAHAVDAERVFLALEQRHQHRCDLAQPGHALQEVHCPRAAAVL